MTSDAQIRVFLILYLRHKRFMYVNYMEKAKLLAAFIFGDSAKVEDYLEYSNPFPAVYGTDVCLTCDRVRSLTVLGGYLHYGCPTCKQTWHEKQISAYEFQQLQSITGISMRWLEVIVSNLWSTLYPRHAPLS